MKKLILVLVGLFLVSFSAFSAEFQAGEILVKYKDNADRSKNSMMTLYGAMGVSKVRRAGLHKNIERLVLARNADVLATVQKIRQNSDVEYAQPNYILHAYPTHTAQRLAAKPVPCIFPGINYPPGCENSPTDPIDSEDPVTPPAPALAATPDEVIPAQDDPKLSKLYGMKKIKADKLWNSAQAAKSFIVAVIDTGIDYNHEDLAFNLWHNPKPDAKLQDEVGYDFANNRGLPFDDNDHGTHTAGTVGATWGNGIGISGVMPRVSIMALKFLTAEGAGTTADAVRAIDYAVAHGAKVLSNSWGGKGEDDNTALKDSIIRAQQQGVLFVAAAGNDGTDNDTDPSYPAAYSVDNMITVAATDKNDKLASFSNFGLKTTHLAAPGVNIYSTVPGNKYASLSGTSMACPHVAGAAAYVWSVHPDWTYQDVKKALLSTVDALPLLEKKVSTGGRLNVQAAMEYVK